MSSLEDSVAEIQLLLQQYSKDIKMTRDQLTGTTTEKYRAGAFDQDIDLHDGQLKLALNEYLALSLAMLYELEKFDKTPKDLRPSDMFGPKDILKRTVVLYIGAAGGATSHLQQLAHCFPNVKFHLYDPRLMEVDNLNNVNKEFTTLVESDNPEEDKKQFTFHQQFFRDHDVKTWQRWKETHPNFILFLINDIRSTFDWPLYYRRRELAINLLLEQKKLQEEYPNTYMPVVEDIMEQNYLHSHELEAVVCEDTAKPQVWAVQMQADYFLSKQRDPWHAYWQTEKTKDVTKVTELHGLHLLQAYARNASTELRKFTVKNQTELGRFVESNADEATKLEFSGNVNDVEIEPQWSKPLEALNSDWLSKSNKQLQDLVALSNSAYRCDNIDAFEDLENKLFAHNKSRKGGVQDSKMKNVIQEILNEYIKSFGLKEHRIRQPKISSYKHGDTKERIEQKHEFNSLMGNMELAYIENKESFREKWKSFRPNKNLNALKTVFECNQVELLENMVNALLKLIQNKNKKQYKNAEDDTGLCQAPVYYTEEHPKWKLHLLTLWKLKGFQHAVKGEEYTDEFVSAVLSYKHKNEWALNHTLAHLQYYFIDFGLTESLRQRQDFFFEQLEKKMLDRRHKSEYCFMPGVISEYHKQAIAKIDPTFFCNRYWAICLYRQFMTFLKHKVYLSQNEFKQWSSGYVTEETSKDHNKILCLGSKSQLKKTFSSDGDNYRCFGTWPWRNPFFHAAAKYGSSEVVTCMLNSEKLYVQNLDHQRLKDGNTAYNLVWYAMNQIHQKFTTNQKLDARNVNILQNLLEVEQIINPYKPKLDVMNYKRESAEMWIQKIANTWQKKPNPRLLARVKLVEIIQPKTDEDWTVVKPKGMKMRFMSNPYLLVFEI